MKVVYFINGFVRGGAEIGLKRLVQGGLFTGCALRIVAIVRGSPELTDEFRQLGCQVDILTDRARMRGRDVLAAAISLYRILRSERPDVLILSLPQANILGRVIGTLARVPTIVSFEHNTHLAKPIYETLFRWTSSLVHGTFADCDETLHVVARRLYRKKPSFAHVVPLVSFPAEAPTGVMAVEPIPRIAMVGRLTTVKNHDVAIEAVALLRQRGRDVRLDIIGEGERREALQALADRLDVRNLVTLVGFVPQWWLRENYAVFVMTSRHEGLCIVALEAMWAGIPVAAARVGGIRDYGSAANMIVLNENPASAEVAAAIERILDQPAMADQMRSAARQTAIDGFGEARVQEKLACLNRLVRAGFAR